MAAFWRHSADDPIDTAITEGGIAALAGSPHFGRLESLRLDGNPIGDAGAVALAKSPHLKHLTYLSLDDCGITHVGAAALAGSDRLRSLVRLSLGGLTNRIDDRAAAALAASPRLEQLSLFMNQSLTAAGKKVLRKRFGKEPMTGYED